MNPLFDAATRVANLFYSLKAILWRRVRQSFLRVLLLITNRRTEVFYFDSIQQGLIIDVPAYLCWDAKNYYKVLLNGVDTTFNKEPILYSNNYSGKFLLEVFGVHGIISRELIMEVKNYEKTRKYKTSKPTLKLNYTQRYFSIYNDLKKLPATNILLRNTKINASDFQYKIPPLKGKTIINSEFIRNVQSLSHYSNYQQDFLNEYNKQYGNK